MEKSGADIKAPDFGKAARAECFVTSFKVQKSDEMLAAGSKEREIKIIGSKERSFFSLPASPPAWGQRSVAVIASRISRTRLG